VQTPTPWMDWQSAPLGQPAWPGVQIRAQYVGVDAPLTSNTHWGAAVVPLGAAGQPPDDVHGGEQKAPGTPSSVTFSSLAAHDVVYGSS
jgi:hypothetical protein